MPKLMFGRAGRNRHPQSVVPSPLFTEAACQDAPVVRATSVARNDGGAKAAVEGRRNAPSMEL